MPSFGGIDHLSLTVTDLDVSERFYTGVLDFALLVDFGYARVCLHRSTGFMLSLVRHQSADGTRFSELNAGLDHVGLAAGSVDELTAWEHRFRAAGVAFTPVRHMPFGSHLNFRDPDGIPLEFYVPDVALTAGLADMRERTVPPEEITARIRDHLLSKDVPAADLPGALR